MHQQKHAIFYMVYDNNNNNNNNNNDNDDKDNDNDNDNNGLMMAFLQISSTFYIVVV